MKYIKYIVLSVSIMWGVLANSEPFIKTDNLWLRTDIETLANLGVVKTPITTWPLTWGPILKDLSNANVNAIPEQYHSTFFRVLRTGRRETGDDNTFTELRISASQEPQLLRYFGDKSRDKREFSIRTSGMSNNFAWNLEVTLAPDSVDSDDKRFDGSYVSAIGGNWVFSLGQMEQWWGPGFQHSIILSNNAKPIPAIYLKRNYAEAFETPLLSWIGPWTFNGFIGQLDDQRTIDQAKLIGMSVAFKPFDSLEFGLRRTAQWGGEGRPETFDSFIDMMIGLDNCDEGSLSCEDNSNEPGNQLAGIDLTWRPNWIVPASLYIQTIGEDEAGYAPSKKSFLFGASANLVAFGNPFMISLETTDTKVDGDGNTPGEEFSGYNVLYEHSIYRHGYRYRGRSIGSTVDNDSKATSLLLTYQMPEWGSFSLLSSQIELNADGNDVSAPGGHSISSSQVKLSEMIFKWRYETQVFGHFIFNVTSRDEELMTKLGDFETTSFGIDWSIRF